VLDWLKIVVPRPGFQISAGQVVSYDADGVEEWHTEKRFMVDGSHDNRVSIRSVLDRDGMPAVEISGNPAKFFQGHNLFGSDDIVPLAQSFVVAVARAAGFVFSDEALSLISQGLVYVQMVDLTFSWDFGNCNRALSAIQGINQQGHLAHRGRGSMLNEGTCYFGKNSRRWAVKFYAKGEEIKVKGHRLPDGIDRLADLKSYADGLVRSEVRVMALELKRMGLDLLRNWRTVEVATTHSAFLSKLNLSEATMTDTKVLPTLSPKLQAIVAAWEAGSDIRVMFKSKETFYRHRRALLAHGIDIAIRKPNPASNVVPLRVVLTGLPVGVPTWAIGTSLYYEPVAA